MFKKILVANRGEIAVRVMRAAREMEIETVAVFSEADRTSLHVRVADEAYCIGPASSQESYLRSEAIIDVARACGAEAIHPGYGFLAENAAFAKACREACITFIGPSPEAMQAMGDKLRARRAVLGAGVPVVPGSEGPIADREQGIEWARKLGFPVLIKAALGGGGKGMRIVHDEKSLAGALTMAADEARAAFADATIYLEKALSRPRHVEFQILADSHGTTVHLGERECSVQRRHQKLIEESPSPALDTALRERMGEAAVKAARAVGYENAGTIEFLLDADRTFYFLEMNTRLQVEHPVTELVMGVDIVKEQFGIAAGEPLSVRKENLTARGAAIECRIYTEDPDNSFMPSGGRIAKLREPSGPWARVDSGVYEGYEVPLFYDPLIAKLIVWGRDREEAIERMRRALAEYAITGVKTTVPFHRRVMENPRFRSGDYDTGIAGEIEAQAGDGRHLATAAVVAAVLAYRERGKTVPRRFSGAEGRWSAWRAVARQEGVE